MVFCIAHLICANLLIKSKPSIEFSSVQFSVNPFVFWDCIYVYFVILFNWLWPQHFVLILISLRLDKTLSHCLQAVHRSDCVLPREGVEHFHGSRLCDGVSAADAAESADHPVFPAVSARVCMCVRDVCEV